MNDDQLLKRASQGDETAFLLLYERHRAALFGFVYRMLGAVEAAEDVTHDCFLSLMRQPGRFDSTRASLRTYLFAAARNLVLKRFRDAGQEVTVEGLAEELQMPNTYEPLHQLLNEELSSKVRQAIASLPPLQREALILFEYEGLSLAEVATIVGTDIGTVKARLHRARERLRRLLAPYFKSDWLVATVEETAERYQL